MSSRLDAERSLVVAVDMQVRLHPAIHAGDVVLAEALRLLRIAALLGVPAWGTEHCPEAIGPLLPEFDGLLARRFGKTSFGACDAPDFTAALDAAGRPGIVLCGYETHVCVLQTALGLRARGHRVALVQDATGSRRPASRDAALARLSASGVELLTTEMVGFEWLRDAAHPRFRDVLRLVK